MPRVIVTARAVAGLERCRRFLAVKNPRAADRAAQAIARQFLLLETHPNIGRPDADRPDFRELLIPFGDSGYVALYSHAEDRDAVYILAFRHQKEAGY
jgi:plasmid stabilization system protein ParE